MTAFVLLAVLSGPPLNPPSLQLRIHCGGGFEGRVIRSEWSRQESYFISKRLEIQQHYRVTIDDDAF
jgi:hypothetical protein